MKLCSLTGHAPDVTSFGEHRTHVLLLVASGSHACVLITANFANSPLVDIAFTPHDSASGSLHRNFSSLQGVRQGNIMRTDLPSGMEERFVFGDFSTEGIRVMGASLKAGTSNTGGGPRRRALTLHWVVPQSWDRDGQYISF